MKPFQEGKTFYACGTAVVVREDSCGETHVYRVSDGERLSCENMAGGVVFGGGKGAHFSTTNVTMESGFLRDLFGGGIGGEIEKTKVVLSGGIVDRFVYGGGLDDVLESAEVFALGGVVRHSLWGAGEARQCRKVTVLFDGTLCTNVRTGSKNSQVAFFGETYFTMKNGHIFDLAFGNANQQGEIFVEIFGGVVEQRLSFRCASEKVHLKLYENIFESNGHGDRFPCVPQDAEILCLPGIEKIKRTVKEGNDRFFFDSKGEEGKLVFRFFSLWHPEIPKEKTPFPDFIGDSFLISFPTGEKMLVDTGMPYSYGEIFEGLKKLGIEKIDYLMITHPHIDHIGNAEKILLDFSVSEILFPDHRVVLPPTEAALENSVLIAAKKQGVPVRRIGRGDRILIGEGELSSEIFILNPNPCDQEILDLNGCSIACKISFQKSSALLCGDISEREEKQLFCQFGKDLSCDLLKVSHHGIVYQNSAAFIDAASPKKAVIQNARDEGAFVKITSFAMEKVNGFSKDNLFVTGKHGKIKAVLSDQGNMEITSEF